MPDLRPSATMSQEHGAGNPPCAGAARSVRGSSRVNELSAATATTMAFSRKRLRKRAGMTQDELATATGYSRALISALEHNQRLREIEVIARTYLPALGLQDELLLAEQLVELAARAGGERPPPP